MTEPQSQEEHIDGGRLPAVTSTEQVGSKRQRRPSVRLGDIGGYQSSDSYRKNTNKNHNSKKQLSLPKEKSVNKMNLNGSDSPETLDNQRKDVDTVAIGSWKVGNSKSKRSSISSNKRIRSNLVSKIDDSPDGEEASEEIGGGEDEDDDKSDSESPVKETSPIHSSGNLQTEKNDGGEVKHYKRGMSRVRASECGGGPADTDARNWNNNGDAETNGVKDWLNQLGLGRYAPVFEIHEVDDEVLPMLTLEDLKDMGINAVGSRRKMFDSIQKLGKDFS